MWDFLADISTALPGISKWMVAFCVIIASVLKILDTISKRFIKWQQQRLGIIHGEIHGEIIVNQDGNVVSSRSWVEHRVIQRSVAALFVKEKSVGILTSFIVLIIAFLGEIFLRGLSAAVSSWTTILIAGFAFCILADNALLHFRVRKGFYGNTESEARELVSYILRNSDSFDGGDGSLRIFDPAETESELTQELFGAGARA